MSDRKRQLLLNAIRIIADEGYGNLSMRALARASDIKLGALQYHFANWGDLLTALANYIHDEYAASLAELALQDEPPDIVSLVDALMEDVAGQGLLSDRLLPQLWAMGRVEPVMGRLLDAIYAEYLAKLEQSLRHAGNRNPRAEALSLMSLIEGSALFISAESPWAADARAVKRLLLKSVREKYGDGA